MTADLAEPTLKDLPSIAQAQSDLVDEFDLFDDWDDRYEYLISLGRKLPAFPEDWKTEANRHYGCQSQVWLVHRWDGDRLRLSATSDALIVSGLIACLLRVYDGRRADEILAAPPDFIAEIGFDRHLSGNRGTGLQTMVEAIFKRAREGQRQP